MQSTAAAVLPHLLGQRADFRECQTLKNLEEQLDHDPETAHREQDHSNLDSAWAAVQPHPF